MTTKSKVSIARTEQSPEYEQIFNAVEKAVDLIGGIREFVRPGQKVLVNPSWVSVVPKREQAAITLPEVARAVADIVKGAGANPIIAESSAIGIDSEKVILDSDGFNAEKSLPHLYHYLLHRVGRWNIRTGQIRPGVYRE